jgi:pimeloyl-ACP methyl ester carboxylesterase
MTERKEKNLSRREMLGSATMAAIAAPTLAHATPQTRDAAKPANFVLVHGAWHGGWCWQRVCDRLTAAGHRVFAPTLTGVCERSHLSFPGVDLSTHISDVVNEILWKDLDRVVLVGHSYGGMVITGVAEQIAANIASIVYVDAFIPADGQSIADLGGKVDPAPFTTPIPAAGFAINAADVAWAGSKMTSQATACFTQGLKVTGAYQKIPRKTYIRARNFPAPPFIAALDAVRRDPSWKTYELECGHDIMIDKPAELTSLLVSSI